LELLDRIPPTAFLLLSSAYLASKGGWLLECMIPQAPFEQLVTDIATRRADAVTIDIKWVCGLVKSADPWTWGVFTLPEADSPEPLRGHISRLQWWLTGSIDNPSSADQCG